MHMCTPGGLRGRTTNMSSVRMLVQLRGARHLCGCVSFVVWVEDFLGIVLSRWFACSCILQGYEIIQREEREGGEEGEGGEGGEERE